MRQFVAGQVVGDADGCAEQCAARRFHREQGVDPDGVAAQRVGHAVPRRDRQGRRREDVDEARCNRRDATCIPCPPGDDAMIVRAAVIGIRCSEAIFDRTQHRLIACGTGGARQRQCSGHGIIACGERSSGTTFSSSPARKPETIVTVASSTVPVDDVTTSSGASGTGNSSACRRRCRWRTRCAGTAAGEHRWS